jgi:hypothetical protein
MGERQAKAQIRDLVALAEAVLICDGERKMIAGCGYKATAARLSDAGLLCAQPTAETDCAYVPTPLGCEIVVQLAAELARSM